MHFFRNGGVFICSQGDAAAVHAAAAAAAAAAVHAADDARAAAAAHADEDPQIRT